MMSSVATDELQVQLLHPDAQPPARTRPGDAGFDLRCVEAFSLAPGERAVVPTGVAVALPEGVAGLVVPRSGLAARHGLSVVNGPGLIDPSYRGELRVVLVNLGTDRYQGAAGDRVAQLLLVPFVAPETRVVEALPDSADGRGADGFGSSGR
jgi:dUTP pyrophosphatase